MSRYNKINTESEANDCKGNLSSMILERNQMVYLEIKK